MNNICPIHQKELRQGKFGLYCATKMEDGSWCKYKGTEESVHKHVPTNALPNNGRTQQQWDNLGRVKALCGMVNGMLSNGTPPSQIDVKELATLVKEVEFHAEQITKDLNPPKF